MAVSSIRKKTDVNKKSRKRQIARVYRRDGGICHYCHHTVEWDQASREHLIPLSEGVDRWDMNNIVLAHKRCNNLKDIMKRSEFAVLFSIFDPTSLGDDYA